MGDSAQAPPQHLARTVLPGAAQQRLFFAQVREDPRIEIEALAVGGDETAVVVSSGGCTALSLLAAGAGRVVGVDLNLAQNHLVELKAVALGELDAPQAVAFLGGSEARGAWRRSTYARLRPGLSPDARAYWDARLRPLGRGVLGAGVSERFIHLIVVAIRLLVHPPSRIRRLLACRTLVEQRDLYTREWDSRRWRLLFAVLLNRVVFRHTYDPAFFQHVENPSFARHFRGLIEHVLVNVPVADNYFVHHMLTGAYPRHEPEGVPPYLQAGAWPWAGRLHDRLALVDGSYGDYLRTCPDASIHAFALSNICEWLDAAQIDDLLGEVSRTAAPGARLVLRNFVGWTEIPPRWRDVFVEDQARSEALIEGDRSSVQRRVVFCRVLPADATRNTARIEVPAVRPATAADNAALVELAEACPMEGDIGMCVERAPRFFALNELEGDRFEVAVVDGSAGRPVGCVAVAERTVYLHGRPTPTMYVGDLKVHPDHRGTPAADALSAHARERCLDDAGHDRPTLVTILAGNQSMERRLGGARGLPHLTRFATIRSHSVSLLWKRRPPPSERRVTRAGTEDLEEMADLWQRVAPGRQFAPVHDAGSLAAWIEAAPGLDISSYFLARGADGRLAGFFGLWDQESFKQLRVTSYSPSLRAFRLGFNALAPVVGSTPLPAAGGRIRSLTAVHVCVPPTDPAVLRALLIAAYNEHRGQGYSFFSVGLDVSDPLAGAFTGLLAQPTDVWACTATSARPYDGPALHDRPMHHEIALV